MRHFAPAVVAACLLSTTTFAQESVLDEVSQQASKLEAELGKYKETSPEAAEAMVKLTDLYHAHGRVFGLIRAAGRFVATHPADSRHHDVMLKLLDGLQATSRNNEFVALGRQFLSRYPQAAESPALEVRLAQILHRMKDPIAAADTYRAVWKRQPNTETGREAGVTACTLYGTGNQKNIESGAELAEEMFDVLPADSFGKLVGWRAFWEWRRISQWAKSNVVAAKLTRKVGLTDKEELWRLYRHMAENYWNQNQHANAAASLRVCRQLRDDDWYVHNQLIERLFHAGAKAHELQPIVNEYVQKYPDRDDRFNRQALLVQAHARDGDKATVLQMLPELLKHDAYSYNNAYVLVRDGGDEPDKLANTERVLLAALQQNQRDPWYLRHVLAFDLYRDRIKDPAKTRQMLRELIQKSPPDDGHAWNAISWLLSNPANDQEFREDVELMIASRRQNFHKASFREYLHNWLKESQKPAKKDETLRLRVAYVTEKLDEANADPIVSLWRQISGNWQSRQDAQLRAQLAAPPNSQLLNDDLARALLMADGFYYRHYSPGSDRPQSATQYGRLAQRLPKDYEVALGYVQAATDFSPGEVSKEAALHIMKFDPPANDSDLWRRLLVAADKAKDAELAKQAFAWISKSQAKFGKDPGYANFIGDALIRHGLEQQGQEYWQTYVSFNPLHPESRDCAWRLMEKMTADQKIPLLQKLLNRDTDYFGRYAVWLAGEFLARGDIDNFDTVLRSTKARYRQRPFLSWDVNVWDLQNIFFNYRAKKDAPDDEKRRVYLAIRDFELDWPSACAGLELLTLKPAPALTPIQQLLEFQRASRMVGNGSYQWDQLMPFAQSLLTRNEFVAAATLLTGMLANVDNVDGNRSKSGQDLVAQTYSRMGAVGLTIDENSPMAPLLQAALYLRLGDDQLALETYRNNQTLFDQHRTELPVDFLMFVCDNHIAGGGDENHDRVEDILRSWLVKHSESPQFDNKTKADVQLLLAKNFAKSRRYDIARSEYTTVINRYAETPQALEAEFGIGETFMEQKVFDQAELAFEKLANSRDADVVVRAEFLRGVLAFRRGDKDEARDIFRAVLDRVPNIELANQALFNLAEVYGDEERYIDQLNLLRTVGRLGRISKRLHTPGQALSIVVQDSDLGISRGHNKIPVIVTTAPGGDEELVYLTSGGAGKGLFRTDLDTQLGQVQKHDKVLQLTGKDSIKCDYPDKFKQEFRRVPLSDVDIQIAADATFEVASSKIIDRDEESFSDRLRRESAERGGGDQCVSQLRPTNEIKPGNLVHLRVKDADRDLTDNADTVLVKLSAESGDEVQVSLTETGPHSGVFEGIGTSGELPAGALASDTAIEHSPLMAIDQDQASFWLSEPDGATPKSMTVDMKDLKRVAHVVIATPRADQHAPVRGELSGSNDGRFWFRLASQPPVPAVEPIAGEFGRMKRRVYAGNYTSTTTWAQVVALSKSGQPIDEAETTDLHWTRPEKDEERAKGFAVLWHGKLVQERDGAARIAVNGFVNAVTIDGRPELPVGRGNNRTVDVWLERGAHDLTIFAIAASGTEELAATFTHADHNAAEVSLRPFRASDFDLEQPFAQPAPVREPATVEIAGTQWTFRIPPSELRHVKFVVHEFLGEALAINNIQIAGAEPDQVYIPTKADILAMASNDVLEIAGGDEVTATYTDEFTQRESGSSRLLTGTLTATYYDANVSPIAYDFVRQSNGSVNTVRKQLMRIDPGDRLIVEIVDYDLDQSDKRDTLRFEVAVNDSQPVEFAATETSEYSGVFTKEIDTRAASPPQPARRTAPATSPRSASGAAQTKAAKGAGERASANQPSESQDAAANQTAAASEQGEKFAVKPGDRIYVRYLDSQNTFPGHAVKREGVVLVNQPTSARVRILETRIVSPPAGRETAPQVVYLAPPTAEAVSKIAFEAPLTVEVIDPDAAKDSGSSVVVALATSDGSRVNVQCVVSGAYSEQNRGVASDASELFALEEGRFIGQVIMQLGSKTSPAVVPITAEMPRELVGGAVAEEDAESSLDSTLVTRVLNLTGQDQISASYRDERRPDGPPADRSAKGLLISNGQLQVTDREYDKPIDRLHVGEKLFLMVHDADQDRSDERDLIDIEVTSEFGEKETVPLAETLAHSGVFTGSFLLKSAEKPAPGNIQADDPFVECYFGDTLHVKYVDTAAGTETGELTLATDVPVVIGTDGLVASFSKTFNDESLAVETKFHIAESYFELFKSHKELGRNSQEKTDLEAGRRVLREVMEDYPDPKYVPRISYLLGQFAQELGQWDEAVEAYEMIVRQHPDHPLAPDAQYKLAQCHEQSDNFDEALEAYVTLAATYPKSPLIANVMIRISDHFYKKEEFDVAGQVGEKFLEKFDTHQYAPRIAFRIGQCYYKSENYTGAGTAFDRFSKQFPDDELAANALFWSGESYRMARNNQEAFRRYNRCRWDFPASDPAKYARGRLALPEMLQQFEAEARNLENQ